MLKKRFNNSKIIFHLKAQIFQANTPVTVKELTAMSLALSKKSLVISEPFWWILSPISTAAVACAIARFVTVLYHGGRPPLRLN